MVLFRAHRAVNIWNLFIIMKREKKYLIKEKALRKDKRIESVAFSMWLDSKYRPTHEEVGWLTYWEYYEIYL